MLYNATTSPHLHLTGGAVPLDRRSGNEWALTKYTAYIDQHFMFLNVAKSKHSHFGKHSPAFF